MNNLQRASSIDMDITPPNSRSRSSSISGGITIVESTNDHSPILTSQTIRRSSAHSPPSSQSSKLNDEQKTNVSSHLINKRVDVVIMCGSSGSRLFPLTMESTGIPKCLLPICNVPILSYLLSSLQKLGFIDIILVSHPLLLFILKYVCACLFFLNIYNYLLLLSVLFFF